jgi:F-type H+-transporting ATPase subunit alpha
MKKVAGTLKLDQAQFRELEAFAKFGSDLDEVTKFVLEKGRRNVEILKQGQNAPMTVEKQVAIIYCGTKGLLSNIPVNKVKAFEEEFVTFLEINHMDTLDAIRNGNIGDDVTVVLEKVSKDLSSKYN